MSAQSSVQICNLALDAIGTRSTIASLQEQSVEAQALARHYSQALSSVLRAAHWNFARKQASLTLLQDGTATPPGNVPQPWVYEYAYPADCVLARYVMPLMQVNPGSANDGQSSPYWTGPPVRFSISSDVDQDGNAIKVLLTNQMQAVLVYTAYIENTGLWDDQFVTAFTHYLAHRIALPLSGDKALAKMAFDIANTTVMAARASNGNEGLTIIDTVPDWIRVRGYADDWAFPPGSYFTIQPQALTLIA